MDLCAEHMQDSVYWSGRWLLCIHGTSSLANCCYIFSSCKHSGNWWDAGFSTRLQKQKGTFQHSSFLAGGATSAAGRLIVEDGILKVCWGCVDFYEQHWICSLWLLKFVCFRQSGLTVGITGQQSRTFRSSWISWRREMWIWLMLWWEPKCE